MDYLRQSAFRVRFDWGLDGLEAISNPDGIIVIVDVLSFSTCVSIATNRGAEVFPFRFRDGAAAVFADSVQARLAGMRSEASALSLSPASMLSLGQGEKVVLPSPNGATLSLAAGGRTVIAGCLRNARAVAGHILQLREEEDRVVSVIAAGEKWLNGNLRFSYEDLLGAGAILAGLREGLSPEAEAAAEIFTADRNRLPQRILDCVSGRELREKGFPRDVELACEYGASGNVPILESLSYRKR